MIHFENLTEGTQGPCRPDMFPPINGSRNLDNVNHCRQFGQSMRRKGLCQFASKNMRVPPVFNPLFFRPIICSNVLCSAPFCAATSRACICFSRHFEHACHRFPKHLRPDDSSILLGTMQGSWCLVPSNVLSAAEKESQLYTCCLCSLLRQFAQERLQNRFPVCSGASN